MCFSAVVKLLLQTTVSVLLLSLFPVLYHETDFKGARCVSSVSAKSYSSLVILTFRLRLRGQKANIV